MCLDPLGPYDPPNFTLFQNSRHKFIDIYIFLDYRANRANRANRAYRANRAV